MNIQFARLALAAAATLLAPFANAQPQQAVSLQQRVAAGSLASLRQERVRDALLQVGSAAQRPAGMGIAQVANVLPGVDRGVSFASERGEGRWLTPSAGPDPSVAWLMALGFLGLVVMRRTRDPLN